MPAMLGGMVTEEMQGKALAQANDALNPENITDRTRATIKFFKDTFWCASCLVQGCGFTTDVTEGGLVWCQSKHFSTRATTTSGEECWGPMGCCSRVNKMFVIVDVCKVPPDAVTIGICNQFFVGGMPDVSTARTPEETDEYQMLNNTFWFYHCICQGIGFQSMEASKNVKGRSKCCCMLTLSEPAPPVGLEGCWMDNYKCCCFNCYTSIPPLLTPGCGCCGYTVLSRIPDVDAYGAAEDSRNVAADPFADVNNGINKVAELSSSSGSGRNSASPPAQVEMHESFSKAN